MELEKTSSNKTIAAMQADLNAASQKAASQFQAGYDQREREVQDANPGPVPEPEQRSRDWDNRPLLEGNPCFVAGKMLPVATKLVLEAGTAANIKYRGIVVVKKPPTNACHPHGYPFADPADDNIIPFATWLEKKLPSGEWVRISWELSGNPAQEAYGNGRFVPADILVRGCVSDRVPQPDPRAMVLTGDTVCTIGVTLN